MHVWLRRQSAVVIMTCRQVFPGVYRDGELVVGNISRRPQLMESQQNTLCWTAKLPPNSQLNHTQFVSFAAHFGVSLYTNVNCSVDGYQLLFSTFQPARLTLKPTRTLPIRYHKTSCTNAEFMHAWQFSCCISDNDHNDNNSLIIIINQYNTPIFIHSPKVDDIQSCCWIVFSVLFIYMQGPIKRHLSLCRLLFHVGNKIQ